MDDFHEIVKKLTRAHERDVDQLRRELEEYKRAMATGDHEVVLGPPASCSCKLFDDGLSMARGPRSGSYVPRRPEARAEGPCVDTIASPEEVAAPEPPPEPTMSPPASFTDELKISTGSEDRPAMLSISNRSKVGNLRIRHEKMSSCQSWVAGPFEHIMGCVIMLNVVLTLIQLELNGEALRRSLDSQGAAPGEAVAYSTATWMFVLEHVFNAVFIVELIVRTSVLRKRFLCGDESSKIQWFNLFDATIVLLSSLDLYLTPLISGQESSANLSFARMLRLARLARTLKVIQVLRAFDKLRILMKTVAASIMSFTWSMTLLGVLNLGAAIFICQMLQPSIADDTIDHELREWLYRMYGTSGRALWTMFEFTHSGGWPTYARPVVEGVHWAYSLFFAMYVSLVVFAVIRIITALFLKDTLNVAARDADLMVQESMRVRREYGQKLRELFEVADTSGDGTIDYDEFHAVCEIPEVIHYFKTLELEVSEAHALFNMLDDGDGMITYDEFVTGVLKLKGTARSMDVISMMHECEMIHKKCHRLEDMLANRTGSPPPRRSGRGKRQSFTLNRSDDPL